MAIGSYDATPLDMAGAYTVFANSGLHLDPWMLASVRTPTGDIITDYTPTSKQVLDPRVAYLTTNMMENVLEARAPAPACATLGFTAPAAGKTGTATTPGSPASPATCSASSGWATTTTPTSSFQGAHAAAPIWAEFMKKAVELPQYSDTHEFTPPEGVQMVKIDKVSNLLSDDACPDGYEAAFLDGTAPTETCDHPADHRNILQKIFGAGKTLRRVEYHQRSAQPSTSLPSAIGWQRGHQKVTRASGPCMRLRIGSPQRRQGSPSRP